MTTWNRNPYSNGICREDDEYLYEVDQKEDQTHNGIYLTITNKKTRKSTEAARIMNRDLIFIEQEADCIIKRLKENNKI